MPDSIKKAGAPTRRRPWFQFSTRGLLTLVTLLAIGLGLTVRRARRQAAAIAMVEQLGGTIRTELTGAEWLRSLFGDEYFSRAVGVGLANTKVTDDQLKHLAKMPHLRSLDLSGTTTSDDGLAHLRHLTAMRGLSLASTEVTDDGMRFLKDMKQLKTLYLCFTQVSDTGLEQLKKLTDLSTLAIWDTAVSDAGFEGLRAAAPAVKKYRMLRDVRTVGFSQSGEPLAVLAPNSGLSHWDGTPFPGSENLWVMVGDRMTTLRRVSTEGVALFPDGKTLATATGDEVKLWNLITGTVQNILENTPNCFGVVVAKSGRALAAQGQGGIAFWDVVERKRTQVFSGSWPVALAPDGAMLAARVGNNLVKIWDVSTGRELISLKGLTYWSSALAFSPDGRALAVGDNSVRIYDVADGTVLLRLARRARSLSFSPDGKKIATADYEEGAVWDVTTGQLLSSLGPTEVVAFSPDGRSVVSGFGWGEVRLHELPSGKVVNLVESSLPR